MREIRTTLIGNATGDPDFREGKEGVVDTTILRIAVTPSYYDNDKGTYGERKTEFVTVFARKKLAHNVAASVTKGQPVVVSGRLGSSEWTGEDGTARHSLTLQADAIGHDLTFGRAVFTRPVKASDVPNHDPVTGELTAVDPAAALSAGDTDDEGMVAVP